MFYDEDDEEKAGRRRSQSLSDVERKPLLGGGAAPQSAAAGGGGGGGGGGDYTNLQPFLMPLNSKKPATDTKPNLVQERAAAATAGTHHHQHHHHPTTRPSPFSSPRQTSPFSSPRMNMLRESPASSQPDHRSAGSNDSNSPRGNVILYLIYASVNIIIAVPGLYGYAAVIFNHPVFQPHMNALAKLVLFSSLVHQLGFLLFSSLDFAIGTVQDAGLIFLSSMANTIANEMLERERSSEAIVATTLVFLSGGTALLGLILVVIGKLGMANAVSYLPMPVIGGYLAFIGYFCIQAGVALCISQPLISFFDWKYLFRGENCLLALPGLLTGMVLTMVSRLATNNAFLPACMVLIPTLFYVILFCMGWTMEEARDNGWVGSVAPPTPVHDVWELVDFSLVEWDLVGDVLWTWAGMVFVVSFASCLDVAAISIDMGEALDTNRELATVGICNFMSGLSFGFTGSYIFSQTIFTYRTGVHSRWIGVFIMAIYLYFVISPLNLLQISPLFFLGSTLIFIGYDLIYEWLYEIRQRVLWSEYATIWGTFLAIQVVGVDAGILVGVLFAIVEHVVANAQATSVHQVRKRSRAVWTKEEYQFLQKRAYNLQAPKIVTIEVVGPVFFGSSLSLLARLQQEVALTVNEEIERNNQAHDILQTSPYNSPRSSPHTSSFLLTMGDKKHSLFRHHPTSLTPVRPPLFCVLDLTQVSNMDASAARSCFMQFCKLCNKRGMTVCASGSTPRIAWMLRSHEAAYPEGDEEESVKARLQAMGRTGSAAESPTDKILLFMTTHEALEFCEASLIHQFHVNPASERSEELLRERSHGSNVVQGEQQVSSVLAKFLGCSPEEAEIFKGLDGHRYHDELEFLAGEKICAKESRPESFYVVLKGAVASGLARSHAVFRHRQRIVSGAGLVTCSSASSFSNIFQDKNPSTPDTPVVGTLWPVGGLFGYSDLLLDRPRTFGAFAAQNSTRVARITRSSMNLLQQEDPALHALLLRVLLRASVLDLANCTCDDV